MKILFVVPGGADLGGIITSTEQYVAGLKEAGHEVTFMTVSFKHSATRATQNRVPRGKFQSEFVHGPGTGNLMHPTQGWRGEYRLSLMHSGERAKFIDLGKKHDIIIWASVYGFNNPDTVGRSDWFEAIQKLKGKHVFFIHDDHLPTRYRWAYALAPYARCFIGVQPCSYDSLEAMSAPRAMVYTPLPALPRQIESVEERSGFLNCQVWKGWKNGHRLVSAAPHMPKGSVSFAGDGIQLRYLRSPDKCPPKWDGWWDAAMKKQRYVGVLQEEQRDEDLKTHKFLVDLSLRSNSGQINRITQEAMAQGCVVIADPRFISGPNGRTPFKAGVHYIPIDAELEGKALAVRLMQINGIADDEYTKIQKAARKALAVFDRKNLGAKIVVNATLSHLTSMENRAVITPKQAKAWFMEVFS